MVWYESVPVYILITRDFSMERIVRQGILFDIYGKLLTERQYQIYSDVVFGDLSLSEAAEVYGISRQGVHDHIKRCDKLLEGYEEKLRILETDRQIQSIADAALAITENAPDEGLSRESAMALTDLIRQIKDVKNGI